jgi:MYXO-CTERM domain-containing protein
VNKIVALSAAAVLATAGSALAQQAVQLQLRFVPETGGFGSGNPLVPGTANGPVTLDATRMQRFRVDYRILDLDTTDAIHPAGLVSGALNITAATTGNLAGATVAQSLLSTRERNSGANPFPGANQLGLDTSNASADATVNPVGGRTGVTGPFRGGFGSDPVNGQNNNGDPSNGTVVGLNINNIVPLALSQTNQGLAGYDTSGVGDGPFLTGTEWYPLFVYKFFATASNSGTVTFSASFSPDPGTGTVFAFFNDGISTPASSTNGTSASITVTVPAVPAPGAMALLGLGGLVAARRRRS